MRCECVALAYRSHSVVKLGALITCEINKSETTNKLGYSVSEMYDTYDTSQPKLGRLYNHPRKPEPDTPERVVNPLRD